MSIHTMEIEINNLINQICNGVTGGELKQLGALFTPTFLDKLSQIIYRDECVKHPNLLINVESELCWIDKAPYAKLCNGTPFDKKVELGDAMFIFDEKIVDAHSKSILNERKKAFILQAKVTEKEAHICNVPIAKYDKSKKDSTYKELELYKQWLNFDIYYASNTSKIEEYNINLINGPSNDPCRFAWYGVAASTKNINSSSNWPCRWMVGKAVLSAPCNKTLGELLSAFYNNHIINGSYIGEYFEGANYFNPDWKKVVHHVLIRSRQLGKPSYFPVHVTTQNRTISSQKNFIASQLIQLFSSFGLNGRIATNDLLKSLSLYPYYPLHHVVSRSLERNIPTRIRRNLIKHIVNILRPLNPITLILNGEYKPRKFPILRVTVQRQEIVKINIDDMT